MVFNALGEWRAAGMYVQVVVAQVTMLPITLRLRFRAGVNPDSTTVQARAVTTNFVNSLGPGASFIVADLANVLKAVEGLDWQGDEVLSPVGDVIPTALQVIRTSFNLVTAAAVQGAYSQQSTNPDYYIIRGMT